MEELMDLLPNILDTDDALDFTTEPPPANIPDMNETLPEIEYTHEVPDLEIIPNPESSERTKATSTSETSWRTPSDPHPELLIERVPIETDPDFIPMEEAVSVWT